MKRKDDPEVLTSAVNAIKNEDARVSVDEKELVTTLIAETSNDDLSSVTSASGIF